MANIKIFIVSSPPLTFIDVNDVGMLDGGHDLDLSSDPDQVCLRLYLALLDGLDGNLINYIQVNRRAIFQGFPHPRNIWYILEVKAN